jgi:transposase
MERATREVWAKRIERWQDSGLTAKEFASELEVSASSLTFWKWKLRRLAAGEPTTASRKRTTAKSDETAARFVQLVPTSTQSSNHFFELALSSGVVVRVPQDFNEATLLRLLGALGAR